MTVQTETPNLTTHTRPKREPYAHRVLRLSHSQDGRCVVFVSGRENKERSIPGSPVVEPVVSFAYVGDRCAAEWCPPYGPIQLCRRAEATDEGAEPHHIYPFIHPNGMDWSQMAVERADLPGAFTHGGWDWIFGELKLWATRWEGES